MNKGMKQKGIHPGDCAPLLDRLRPSGTRQRLLERAGPAELPGLSHGAAARGMPGAGAVRRDNNALRLRLTEVRAQYRSAGVSGIGRPLLLDWPPKRAAAGTGHCAHPPSGGPPGPHA